MFYSQYTSSIYTAPPVMYLDISTNVGGYYLDNSGHDYHASVATINSANDALALADDETLRTYIRYAGLFQLFYDIEGTPIPILLSQIGRIYNNILLYNDVSMCLFPFPLTGGSLKGNLQYFFGDYDADALSIIASIGVTSIIHKRLIDTHVKDLKALNLLQANLFKYNDLTNSVIKELHPMVGDTFDQMKYNWIKPTDEDSSYRLEIANGSVVRVLRNCINFDTTFCLDTNFNAYAVLDSTNSFSYYSLFNFPDGYINRFLGSIVFDENRYEMGCLGTTGQYAGIALAVKCENISHSICENTYQNPTKGVQYEELQSSQYYLTNKLANDNLKQYRQGVQIGSTVTNAGVSSYYNGNIILGGYSLNGSIQTTKNSTLPCGYYHIGGAIDTVALTAFQDAVIRLCSSKNYFYYPPDETAPI